MRCIPKEDCPYSVNTANVGYDEYTTLLDQSCGAHLKLNLASGYYNCEVFQINLLQNGNGDLLEVAVMAYSPGVTGGYANVTCPIAPTFDLNTLTDGSDPNMEGMLLFVKQQDYTSLDPTSATSDWNCTV